MIENRIVCYGVEGVKNGCNFYRIKQPLQKASQLDLFPCATSSMLDNLDEQTLWTDKADVIVSQCGTSEKYLEYILAMKGKKKFVLDYDDNIFNVSPYNPSYEYHGLQEVDVELNGEKIHLWKDGERKFNLKENRKRILTFVETMRNVDLVTCPSAVLSGTFKKYGAKSVRVIKNFIDFSVWNPVNMVKDEYIRIGYQGGWSHYEDWLLIQGVLPEIMEKYKNVILVIMGQSYEGTLKNLPKDRVVIEPWISIEAYPYKFKTLNIDIGICPLANTEFATCKSELKWEEYSAFGIPAVCSDIPPYRLAVRDGETGYLAKTEKDWKDYISMLIVYPETRKKIGTQAMSHVKQNYDLNKEVYQYKNAYDSMFNRELAVV